MKRNFLLILLVLLVPTASVFALDISAGLSLGYTPFSLNKTVANTILDDNSSWETFNAITTESVDYTAASIPRNLMVSASAEVKLSKKFFIQIDLSYGLGLGGKRTAANSTGNIGGGNNFKENEDSINILSIPLFFGIRHDILKIGIGVNLTTVTYKSKQTVKDAGGVVDLTRSYDREWTGSTLGWNLLIGTDISLGTNLTLGIDLIYLSAPLELKRDGLNNLDDAATDIEYYGFPIEGWYVNLGIKYKL